MTTTPRLPEYQRVVRDLFVGVDPHDDFGYDWRVPFDHERYARGMEARLHRYDLVYRYSFAIPNEEAFAAIARHGPIVELGAGNGYWAHELRQRGVDVLAYDIAPLQWETEAPPPPSAEVWACTPVRQGDASVVAQHSDRALFLCWPPMSDMAAEALRHYSGTTVLYIGEGNGGCTADEAFFSILDRDYELEDSVSIPQWPGIHDYLMVWHRVSPESP